MTLGKKVRFGTYCISDFTKPFSRIKAFWLNNKTDPIFLSNTLLSLVFRSLISFQQQKKTKQGIKEKRICFVKSIPEY